MSYIKQIVTIKNIQQRLTGSPAFSNIHWWCTVFFSLMFLRKQWWYLNITYVILPLMVITAVLATNLFNILQTYIKRITISNFLNSWKPKHSKKAYLYGKEIQVDVIISKKILEKQHTWYLVWVDEKYHQYVGTWSVSRTKNCLNLVSCTILNKEVAFLYLSVHSSIFASHQKL